MKLRPGERRRIDTGIYARGRGNGRVGYEIRFKYRGREVRESAGPTITMARKALAVRKAEIAQGRFSLEARLPSPTFRTFGVQYLAHARTNKASWRLDELCVRTLTTFFKDRRLAAITAWEVERYKMARREQVSARTVNIELSVLRRMFTLAREWRLVRENPVVGVRRFREVIAPVRVLSPEEEQRLLVASPPHLRDMIVLALNTGLRLGELRAARVGDVEGAVLRVRAGKGKARIVPLNATAAALVDRARAAGSPTILSYRGKPIGRVYRTWYRSIKKAALPGLRIHDLRHSFASRLVRAGVDLATVRDLLGHSTLQMTSRYAHSGMEAKIAATAILER